MAGPKSTSFADISSYFSDSFQGLGGIKFEGKGLGDFFATEYMKSPDYALQVELENEKKRKEQEAATQKEALTLQSMLTQQKSFAQKAQGRQGSILTNPLGIVNDQSGGATKTLLGT